VTRQPDAHYEGLDRQLRPLATLVERVDQDLARWFCEYLDAAEYGLAVEVVTERLTADMRTSVVRPLAAGLLHAAEAMELAPEMREELRHLARP
jgi:hypothetical protein